MTERYDILTVRESNGKSYFTKLGALFVNKAGDGFNIMLEGVPASTDGQYRLIAKRPQERTDATRQTGGNGGNRRDELDDSIPF